MAQLKDNKTGKWMYYGSYIDATNKRIQYKKRGYKSRKEARKAEDAFRENLESPTVGLSFGKLAEEYLTYEKKQNKEASYHDTTLVINRLNTDIKDIRIKMLTSEYLQDYVDILDDKYSQKYVTKLFYTISKIFNFAVNKKYINTNPIKLVKMNARKNEIKKELMIWEPDEFKKFIANVDSQMYYLLFSFLYYMGVRRGEALALTWNKVDFIRNVVRIDRSVATKLNNKITTPKTANSIRTISVPKNLIALMKSWKSKQQELYEFDEERFVFGYQKVIAAETLRRQFKLYTEITNAKLKDIDKIPVIRIHDLRHAHASYLINNMSSGFTDFDIAKRLGDTVSTLHSTYAHWFKSADKSIIDFMDNDIIKTPTTESKEIIHTKV